MRLSILLVSMVAALPIGAVAQGLSGAQALTPGASAEEIADTLLGQEDVLAEVSALIESGAVSPGETFVGAGALEGVSIDLVAPPSGDSRSEEEGSKIALRESEVRFPRHLEVDIAIKFAFDSAVLSPDARPDLDRVCRAMERADAVEQFKVIGHTDSSGTEVYNRSLSKLRAEEVGRYFVNECGIPASRLVLLGYGESYPKNPADRRAPENRRVEFQVAAPTS